MTQYARRLAWRLALCLTVIGCRHQPASRADRARVSGSVTFAERALPAASLGFVSAANPQARVNGILQSDGTFVIDDVPLGRVLVTVDTEPIRGGAPQRYVKIPAKYANPQTSGLTYEVQAGENAGAHFALE